MTVIGMAIPNMVKVASLVRRCRLCLWGYSLKAEESLPPYEMPTAETK